MEKLKLEKEIQAAADIILAIVLEHEVNDHDGEACWQERANAAAYLIHKLGLYWLKGMLMLMDRCKEYEKGHPH